MIRYSLQCEHGHDFESWFASSDAYDKQVKRKLVTCPVCGSAKGREGHHGAAARAHRQGAGLPRRSAAPAPAPAAPEPKAPVAMISPQEREFRQKLKALRDHLIQNAEHVGARFPEEARKMHYGEIEHRSIYGEASPDEAKALHEEGIEFHPLPVLPEDRNCPAERNACSKPRSTTRPRTISTIPAASRAARRLLSNTKREIACANRTSTSASVRTLAAVAIANARYQNCDASAPMKPANSDGRQARAIANSTWRTRRYEIERQNDRLQRKPDHQRERRRHHETRIVQAQDCAAKPDRGKTEQGARSQPHHDRLEAARRRARLERHEDRPRAVAVTIAIAIGRVTGSPSRISPNSATWIGSVLM